MKYLLVCAISFFTLAVFSWSQENSSIEVPTNKDDLEEIQLKSRLEDRLARDIQAYLGHTRFIVNVDVTLQKIRKVVKEPKAPVPSNQTIPVSPNAYPTLRFPRVSSGDDSEVESLPGLPFVDIPTDKEKDAELQFMREQIERLQRAQRQPQWDVDGQNGRSSSTEKTIAVFNRIKKLYVSLLVENDITAEQELFLRNLVYQKAALNDLRGDEFKLMKTAFNKLPSSTAMNGERGEAKDWFIENFDYIVLGLLALLAGLLLATLIMLLKRKDAPVASSPLSNDAPILKPPGQAFGPDDISTSDQADNKQSLLRTRQDIISLGLGQPQGVQNAMEELLNQEDKIPMVASIYKILGRSLFRSIFPNVEQMQLQSIMAQLADQPPDEQQQSQDVRDFYQLLQQKLAQVSPAHAHPFEFLNKLNDSQVLYLIQHEEPRIQALVISQLDAEQAARVLNRIPDNRQAMVMAELGQFETFPLDTFKDVADRLAKSAQHVPSFENVNANGLAMLMTMLDNMSSGEEAKVLKRLRHDKPDTFYRLRQMYFTFSDISRTPKGILSNALREVDRGLIGRALCNTPDEFKVHVLTALTPKLKALVREDLKRLEGRIEPKDIDKGRKAIVHKMREYINTGKFSMDQLQSQRAG